MICVYDGLGAERRRENWRAYKPDKYCYAKEFSQFAHCVFPTLLIPCQPTFDSKKSGREKIEARKPSMSLFSSKYAFVQ